MAGIDTVGSLQQNDNGHQQGHSQAGSLEGTPEASACNASSKLGAEQHSW